MEPTAEQANLHLNLSNKDEIVRSFDLNFKFTSSILYRNAYKFFESAFSLVVQ